MITLLAELSFLHGFWHLYSYRVIQAIDIPVVGLFMFL